MSARKIPFSQHVTLMILLSAALGMLCWFIKQKKISPEISDIRSEIRDIEGSKKYLESQEKVKVGNPKTFKKKLENLKDQKEKLSQELKGLNSSLIQEDDYAGVQKLLLEIVSIANKHKLNILEQKPLQKAGGRHPFKMHFKCLDEKFHPFLEEITKLSYPVILDSVNIENNGEILDTHQLDRSTTAFVGDMAHDLHTAKTRRGGFRGCCHRL